MLKEIPRLSITTAGIQTVLRVTTVTTTRNIVRRTYKMVAIQVRVKPLLRQMCQIAAILRIAAIQRLQAAVVMVHQATLKNHQLSQHHCLRPVEVVAILHQAVPNRLRVNASSH